MSWLLWIMGVQMSITNCDFAFFQSGIAGSYVVFIFNFLRHLHTVFHRGCSSLHSYQQCTRVPFSPYLCQSLLFLVFLITVILTDVRCHLIVVLIYTFLMSSDADPLFDIFLIMKKLLWIFSGKTHLWATEDLGKKGLQNTLCYFYQEFP